MIRAIAWLLFLALIFCAFVYAGVIGFQPSIGLLNSQDVLGIALTTVYILIMLFVMVGIALPQTPCHISFGNWDLLWLASIVSLQIGLPVFWNLVERGSLKPTPVIVGTEMTLKVVVPTFLFIYVIAQRKGWVE
jgi:hypothetical protein